MTRMGWVTAPRCYWLAAGRTHHAFARFVALLHVVDNDAREVHVRDIGMAVVVNDLTQLRVAAA